jgi:phosphoheptose isomerase
MIAACFNAGNKLLVCGNGGSAADSQHFAAEFAGRFKETGRRALPAIALTADGSFLTAWANDSSFDDVFARQIEALGKPGDVLFAISTSGTSENTVRALRAGAELGMQTIGLLGRDGGAMRDLADLAIIAPGSDTQRIQELHILLIHIICELVEARLFASPASENENGHRPLEAGSARVMARPRSPQRAGVLAREN